MKDDSVITRPHHRRPRSLGGKSVPSNISYIIEEKHKWHIIVGNMNVFQIAKLVNNLKERKPYAFKIRWEFINGSEVKQYGGNNSKNKSLILQAWDSLFKGMNFRDIIEYINNVFLDPSYHLYVDCVDEDKKIINNVLERCLINTLKK